MTSGRGAARGECGPFARAMLRVALYRPEIPQNAGNVARTCAATHTPLHLIEPLGFQLSSRHLKRAGLDYWPHVQLEVHPGWQALCERLAGCRFVFFSASGQQIYHQYRFRRGDCLVFGSETQGLPHELLAAHGEDVLHLPIDRNCVRSLNLSTAVGIALFEATRQLSLESEDSGESLLNLGHKECKPLRR
jgi:tRNA (cytidine/uridine-2'-O-)-methyltransferase